MKNETLLFLLTYTTIFLACQKDAVSEDNDVNEPDTPGTATTINKDEITPCKNGLAAIYPCNGFDLLGHIDLKTFQSTAGNDVWGWTDPETLKEYVLMGLDDGTAFVDISQPTQPLLLGKLQGSAAPSSWRDVKVYDNHAYIVSEASGHGIQIFDLTRLRNVKTEQTFSADAVFKDIPTAHNMVINQATGYGYAVGTDRNDQYYGGVHFLNLSDPKNIKQEGGFGDSGYSHDAQVVVYKGPDTDYTEREIFFGSNEYQLAIVDVTDKKNPKSIGNVEYPNAGYTHQGWLTEDHRFFILGDELDESGYGGRTRSIVFDLQDLDRPTLHTSYRGTTNAIDHNGYVRGDIFYLANYTAGLRAISIDDLGNKNMSEIGYFDSYPADNSTSFGGAWSVYPFFESGVIAISDIESGLFLVLKSDQ
jgi:choice-of-anchor B domain-containing protein